MQAVAAELSGCAGQSRCFLERRVLIAKHSSTQALKHSSTQALKHSSTQALKHSSTQALKHSSTHRTQEEPTVSRRGPHRSILAFLSTRVLECLSSFYFKELSSPQ